MELEISLHDFHYLKFHTSKDIPQGSHTRLLLFLLHVIQEEEQLRFLLQKLSLFLFTTFNNNVRPHQQIIPFGQQLELFQKKKKNPPNSDLRPRPPRPRKFHDHPEKIGPTANRNADKTSSKH